MPLPYQRHFQLLNHALQYRHFDICSTALKNGTLGGFYIHYRETRIIDSQSADQAGTHFGDSSG